MKFKFILSLIGSILLVIPSANAQNSSVPKIVQENVSKQRMLADSIKDSSAIQLKQQGLNTLKKDSSKTSLQISYKNPSLYPFNIMPYPTVYGKFVGGFLKSDKIYNSTKLAFQLTQQVRKVKKMDWIFYLFCSLLLFLSILNAFFRKYLNDLFVVFFKTSMRQNQLTEQIAQATLPSLLLDIFFIISGGLLIYFVFLYPKVEENAVAWIQILYCIAIPAILYFFKYLTIRTISWLFSKSEAGKNYLFNVFLVNKITGLFLVPMSIGIAYSAFTTIKIFVTITIIGLTFLLIMRMVKCFLAINQVIKISLIQFSLLVVSFEVIPVLMICKVLLWVIG
jgi:hypothetical protein